MRKDTVKNDALYASLMSLNILRRINSPPNVSREQILQLTQASPDIDAQMLVHRLDY